MTRRFLVTTLSAVILSIPGSASIINVNLDGATSGALITAPGASFAETFLGQAIVGGTGISGRPTTALMLSPSGTLDVQFWIPGVSSPSNSILPEPGNQGPLSVLLGSDADSITWTMGYGNPPSSINIDFFAADGKLVKSVMPAISEGYNIYSLSGFGPFRGLTIYNDDDPAGVRFMNFSYITAVPEPSPGGMIVIGFALLGTGAFLRRVTA